MAIGGIIVWAIVVVILVLALRGTLEKISERRAGAVVFVGGVVFPTATVVALLAYALWLMPSLRPFAQVGTSQLSIEITGRQFWWNMLYRLPDGTEVISANELVLPLGERVELTLKSSDVIHSFWIPSLAGKVDMIPGRTNRLSLMATKTGRFRGPCAEFCGTSHALMAIDVTVLSPDAFANWVQRQARPSPGVGLTGAELFIGYGCGSCHRVAGTAAQSRLGPDLSHLGSRSMLAAGVLPNTEAEIARFIVKPELIKPGVQMPAFDMLPPEDIRAMALWLKGLQ